MTNRPFRGLAAGALIALATSGCYDLSVATTDDALTRDAVINDPTLIDRVIAGVGINLWAGIANASSPHLPLAVLGEELTSSSNDNFMWAIGQEPRPAIDNQVGTNSLSRDAWSNLYEANAAATEMQRVIRETGIRIVDPQTGFDNTQRDLAWGKFVQGASHGYLSMLFDKAAIVTDTVDLSEVPDLPFAPYTEVRDSALKWLDQAATMAENNVFSFPFTDALWFWNLSLSNGEFAQVIHSIAARVMVYSARTPADRAALDWERVLYHAERSINFDFGPGGDGSRPNPLLTWGYKIYAFNPPAAANGVTQPGAARVDLRLLGPADTVVIATGPDAGKTQYQVWLEKVDKAGRDTVVPFSVFSPDRRIGRPGQNPTQTGTDPFPIFFRHTTTAPPPLEQPPERGPYYVSNYYSISRSKAGLNTTGNMEDIRDISITVAEMDLIRAEALINLGRAAEALPFINKTRVTDGGLPAVTTAGPPQSTAAEIASCVPRRFDGTCGNLMEALMYEKRIATFGSHGITPYADLRGWGCLLEGTPTDLPIPARQLDLLGREIYTFGGQPGQPGSAPVPSACPLLVNPNVRGS